MSAATEFDVGPLTWVKGEIDLALERSDQALLAYTASVLVGKGDLTQIKFCRTHLHQVQGALTIVGLDGVKQFAEALERLLEGVEYFILPAGEATIDLAHQSLEAIGVYLDDLLAGRPNQPLRLMPLYREIQQTRGVAGIAPSDLFFPDLGVRPPRRETATEALPEETLRAILRQARAHFQRGFLSWLRNPRDRAGAAEMRGAVERIEATQDAASARAFWWVSSAFLAALGEGGLPDGPEVKQLCARIDLQIRRLADGSQHVAERLMRDVLYFIANTECQGETVQQVKAAYRLQPAPPPEDAPPVVPKQSVRRRLRDAIASAEEAWVRYSAGAVHALPLFADHVNSLVACVEQLSQTDYRRLAQAIAVAAKWLSEDPARHSTVLAIDVATALLLAQRAQEAYPDPGGAFAPQVDLAVARIHACLAGHPAVHASEEPLLGELSRQAQDKLMVGQVARDIQTSLAQIEQILDAFFRETGKRDDLVHLEPALSQIEGALAMLHHDDAVAAMRQCATDIRRFSDPEYLPASGDFERVASQLSLIGFFVDAMRFGPVDYAAFVQRVQSAKPVFEETADASVEGSVARQKREAQALLSALRAQPGDADLRAELRDNMTALRNDADLVADAALGEHAKVILSALDSDAENKAHWESAMANFAAPSFDELQPSVDTVQLAQSSREEIDAELLGIFLEEAHDVLATIDESMRRLKEQSHELDQLTTIRRAFHTLKGSGRMVGLLDIGEAAWTMEKTLNHWLMRELPVTLPLTDLVFQAYVVFSDWVNHLEFPSLPLPDPTEMVQRAESLMNPEAIGLASGANPPAEVELTPRATEAPARHSAEIIAVDFAAGAVRETQVPPPGADDVPTDADGADSRPAPVSPSLLVVFREEAGGHVQTLKHGLQGLEADETLPTPPEMIRAAHTLGGISAALGASALSRLGHVLESVLSRRDVSGNPGSREALATLGGAVTVLERILSAADFPAGEELPSGLLESLDALYPPKPVGGNAKTGTSAPRSSAMPPLKDEIDAQLLPIFLDEASEINAAIAAELRAWRDMPDDREAVRRLARLLHTLKGSARMAGAMNLGQITHAIETHVEATIRDADASVDSIDEIDAAFDDVRQIIERLQHGETLDAADDDRRGTNGERAGDTPVTEDATPAEGGSEPGGPRATLRVRAELIDRLANEAGELAIARSRIEGEMRGLKDSLLDLTESVARLRRQLREVEMQAELQMQSHTAQADAQHTSFDPLEFDRFTRFQELTRMMAEAVNDVGTVQQHLLKNVDDANAAIVAQARVNRDIQQELMAVRMVPFGTIDDRLYRIVRQTSKELNKRANLEIAGSQVELDRSVLEKMVAPLEHMLRNSIAHGLEARDIRRARGKPEIGELALALQQEGNEIVVRYADDGAGLDFERIRARAVELGVLGADEAAGEARLAEMIFLPGFSTAAEVSQVSGRGVGMDVVKTEVAALGGRIEVLSVPGERTEFRLYIPLTLALTKALLVRAANKTYAIPSAMIEQVLDLKERGLTDIRHAGCADWMGQRYPFSYLPRLLGDMQALPEQHRQYWVLLLKSGARRIAVQVDGLLGNREIVVKNVGPQVARIVGVDGATVLGDGQVVMILNPVALSARTPAAEAPAPVPFAAPSGRVEALRARLPTVMIVDDSLTVRKVTGRLFAREGYQVLVAKDGVEALEQLLDVIPDVMLVDIEMPRLDGFDLTRNIRSDTRLKHVPIIMITSRTGEKHRNYAFEIGVNHFLGKPFQEEELLRLVASYAAPPGALTTA